MSQDRLSKAARTRIEKAAHYRDGSGQTLCRRTRGTRTRRLAQAAHDPPLPTSRVVELVHCVERPFFSGSREIRRPSRACQDSYFGNWRCQCLHRFRESFIRLSCQPTGLPFAQALSRRAHEVARLTIVMANDRLHRALAAISKASVGYLRLHVIVRP